MALDDESQKPALKWHRMAINGEIFLWPMYLAYTNTLTSSTVENFHHHQQVVHIKART